MDMLEQTTPPDPSTLLASSDEGHDPTAPLSVSAPRASARTPQLRANDRLCELVGRAEMLLLHLEFKLNDERSASERAARTTADLEERLRLGVRMLQALDVQVERGEHSAREAQAHLINTEKESLERQRAAEASLQESADRLAREKLEWLERELAWRFDRLREVDERIEQAVNGKLAWLDTELGHRLGRLNEACTQTEQVLARAERMFSEFSGAAALLERAERVAANLTECATQGEAQINALQTGNSEAQATSALLRETGAAIAQDFASAREFVSGEVRRMRDDLFWLTERGERISTELVERADSAAVCSHALRTQTEAATPVLAQCSQWAPLLLGEDRAPIQPVAEAIANRVRDALALDMRGFSGALRQFADRADHAFQQVTLEHDFVERSLADQLALESGQRLDAPSARAAEPTRTIPNAGELARRFATELSRLGQASKVSANTANSQPTQPANSLVEIELAVSAAASAASTARATATPIDEGSTTIISVNRPIELTL